MKKPEWSPVRLKNFIIAALRSASTKYPPKYQCLHEAKVGKKVNKESGRLADHYRCAKCKKHFVLKKVQVDHIEPVIDPFTGFVDWNTYVFRLFCPKENMQVLCVECHKKKTMLESKKRQ